MTITLTREEAQQVLDALDEYRDSTEDFRVANRCISLIKILRARLAQPEPEPIAYKVGDATVYIKPPIYTAPPQREWQGLTDEEITALKRNGERYISSQDFSRAIENKLKEKNT